MKNHSQDVVHLPSERRAHPKCLYTVLSEEVERPAKKFRFGAERNRGSGKEKDRNHQRNGDVSNDEGKR